MSYEFDPRNANYGGKPILPEDFKAAYEAAPACHHPKPAIASVALTETMRYEHIFNQDSRPATIEDVTQWVDERPRKPNLN